MPEGALHRAVERAPGADERAAFVGPPEQVQRSINPRQEGRRGHGGARDVQGARREDRPGVP